MENTTIRIEGMSCQGCVKNVSGVLGALAGVAKVAVTLEPAEAVVDFDPARLSRQALCAAIEEAGFDAR
jgi:copper chaperone